MVASCTQRHPVWTWQSTEKTDWILGVYLCRKGTWLLIGATYLTSRVPKNQVLQRGTVLLLLHGLIQSIEFTHSQQIRLFSP